MFRPGSPEKLQKLTDAFSTQSPTSPVLMWITTNGWAPAAQPSEGLLWEHPASPWVYEGWGLGQKETELHSALKRRSCAEGEGRKAAGASSQSPGKCRAGNVPSPLPNCQTPAPPQCSQDTCLLDRSPSDSRTSWNPRLRLPEKAVSQWVEKSPAKLTPAAATGALGSWSQVQNFIQAPRLPSGKGKPGWASKDANGLQFVTINYYECRKVVGP